MKLHPRPNPLPHHDPGFDISMGRLKMRVYVLDSERELRRFWKRKLGKGDLGPHCSGCVNSLWLDQVNLDTLQTLNTTVDPVYFCAMGLVRSRLTCEVLSHECTHAALALVKRRRRVGVLQVGEDEEELCYAVGRIFRRLVNALTKRGYLE